MTTRNNKDAERQALEDLLPWHAAGTLSRQEAQLVEAALARDPELARLYELVRGELAGTIQLNETLEKLFARIDAEPARRMRRAPGLGARMAEFLASLSPPTLAWAAVAAAVVIMLQAGVIGSGLLKSGPGGSYVTASAPGEAAGGTYVLIRFAPKASAADVTAFLEARKASIAGGPAAGFYRVRVAPAGLQKEELSNIIKEIQKDKTVDFVARAP